MKSNWASLRAFLQAKVNTIADVHEKHDEEVTLYKEFVDYLEPGLIKDKLQLAIVNM